MLMRRAAAPARAPAAAADRRARPIRPAAGSTPARPPPLRRPRAPSTRRIPGPVAAAAKTSSPPPPPAAAASSSSSSSPDLLLPPLRDASALYVRGTDLSQQQQPDEQDLPSSLVVLGDVPAGAVAAARGDVVVVGRLAGAARCSSPSALVFALSVDASTASVEIGGRAAAVTDLSAAGMIVGGLVAALDQQGGGGGGGGSGVVVRPLPSSAAAATAAAPSAHSPPSAPFARALSLAQQLAPVALGLAVVAAPATALSALSSVGGADGLAGSVVEALLFGFIILQGAKLLSEGSELLLEVLDPGVVGGVLLPVLGATPDALIILSSGLGGSQAEAAQQLSVGVGTLAGSNALLLSPAWAAAVFAGRCDLDARTGEAIDRRLTIPLFGGAAAAAGGAKEASAAAEQDNSNSSSDGNNSGNGDKSAWTGTGVTVDPDVQRGAAIMAASVLLYGSVQVPAALFNDALDPRAAAAGAAACFLAGAAYCVYSVASPGLQRRRIAEARKRRLRSLAAETLASRWMMSGGGTGAGATSSSSSSSGGSSAPGRGPLLDGAGKVRPAVADAMFDEFDADGSGHIDGAELRALLLGLQLGAGGAPGGGGQGGGGGGDSAETKAAIEFFWGEMDADGNSAVSREEFASALQRWVDEKLSASAAQAAGGGGGYGGGGGGRPGPVGRMARADAWRRLLDPRTGGANAALVARLRAADGAEGAAADLAQLQDAAEALAGEEEEEAAGEGDGESDGEGAGADGAAEALSRPAIITKACTLLAGGLGLCAVFSDPLVEALSHLAQDLNVDPFFVAFALTPLASNASEVLSSLSFVGRKRRRNASLAFSNLYGSATINNTLVLGILLAIISARGIPWVYSSETAAIVFVSAVAGAVAASRATLPLWLALPVAAAWPVTLGGVWFLDTYLGWT